MELAILMSIAAIAGTVWYVYKRQKRTIAIAFEEAGKIAGLPLVILQQGERSFCFLIDSGSNRSHISTEFLNDIEVKLHKTRMQCCGIEGNYEETGLGMAAFEVQGIPVLDAFLISNLKSAFEHTKGICGIQIHGILGNTFLCRYNGIIDYPKHKLIIHNKPIKNKA